MYVKTLYQQICKYVTPVSTYTHTRKYPPGKQKFGGFSQISLRLFELQKS